MMIRDDEGDTTRTTTLFEINSPWSVTPILVERILARANIASHEAAPAHVAIEQLYGYMVRNAIQYGILTTMKGWCFLRRRNGGILQVTRMYGNFKRIPGERSDGAECEGYRVPARFSIMQALYYISSLPPLDVPETPGNGVPGQIRLPKADGHLQMARQIGSRRRLSRSSSSFRYNSSHSNYTESQGLQISGEYNSAECVQYREGYAYQLLQFEPWKQENALGTKTWSAKTLPDHEDVVLKFWDGWKLNSEDQTHEETVYLHLKDLWGKNIPSLCCKFPLEYFHALVFEYVRSASLHLCSDTKAEPVSAENCSPEAEAAIINSFEAIHSRNVGHGGIRAKNILVGANRDGGRTAWIVNFEFAETWDEQEKESRIAAEMDAIRELLMGIKVANAGSIA
jgi:hypothetical protein